MAFQLTLDDIDEQIKDLMTQQYVAADSLSLFREIFEAQYEIEGRLRMQEEDIYPSVSKTEIDMRLESGLPVIDPDKLRLSEKELADLLRRITLIFAKYGMDAGSSAGRLLESGESGLISFSELMHKVLTDDREYFDRVCRKTGKNEDEIRFVAEVLIAPFLRVCAGRLSSQVDLELVQTRRCPVCGGLPVMAKLRVLDGKRVLECSLCNTQWVFRRIGCPFCDNGDQATLGFFFTEEEDADCRVDTCDKCKRYIKTVDERKKAKDKLRALPLEDAATLYLDMLAAEEGFRSIRKAS